jgi:hypothetical protein
MAVKAVSIAEVYARGRIPVVKRTIICLLLVATASSVSAANFSSDEQTLRTLEREMAIARYMADINWFRTHLDDGYVLITSSGATETKRS